jgi:hypothetical protein
VTPLEWMLVIAAVIVGGRSGARRYRRRMRARSDEYEIRQLALGELRQRERERRDARRNRDLRTIGDDR